MCSSGFCCFVLEMLQFGIKSDPGRRMRLDEVVTFFDGELPDTENLEDDLGEEGEKSHPLTYRYSHVP